MSDEFPNNFVGDLVKSDRGTWTVVPPTACPDGHPYSDPGWSVTTTGCSCNGFRHYAWRCWCGATVYAPQLGPHCRVRDIIPVSPWEEDQRRAARHDASRQSSSPHNAPPR